MMIKTQRLKLQMPDRTPMFYPLTEVTRMPTKEIRKANTDPTIIIITMLNSH